MKLHEMRQSSAQQAWHDREAGERPVVRGYTGTQLNLDGGFAPVMFSKENTNTSMSSDSVKSVGDFRHEQQELMKSPGYRSYLKFLSKLFDERTSKTTGNSFTLGAIVGGCGFRGKIYQEIDGVNAGYYPLRCQEIDMCLKCSTNYTLGQASDTFDLFHNIVRRWKVLHGEQLDFWQDVFTLPRELWTIVPDDLFRKAISKFFYRAYGSLPATLINIQRWHSKSPLGGDYPHAHCDSLNLFYDKDKGFHTINSFVDVDKNRAIWLRCVKELAVACGLPMDSLTEVNLNRSYVVFDEDIEHLKMIRHALNYDMRKPVGDIVKWINDSNKIDFHINEGHLREMHRLLSDKNNKKAHVWIGWLADCVKNKYMELLGLHIKTDNEIKEEQKELEKVDGFIHPVTGKKMALFNPNVHLDDVPDDCIILRTCDRIGYKEMYGSKVISFVEKRPDSVLLNDCEKYKRLEVD